MHTDTAKMLEALNAFHPQPGDDAQGDLYEITDGFNDLPDKEALVPSMFSLIERADDVDFGAPGPLVHCIEKTAHKIYFPRLIESLRRRPQFTTLMMAERILNARRLGTAKAPDYSDWQLLMDTVRHLANNASAKGVLRRLADECFALNSNPEAG